MKEIPSQNFSYVIGAYILPEFQKQGLVLNSLTKTLNLFKTNYPKFVLDYCPKMRIFEQLFYEFKIQVKPVEKITINLRNMVPFYNKN